MSEKRKPTSTDPFVAHIAARLRSGGPGPDARRRRSEFVRAVEPSADVLAHRLGVRDDVARGLESGAVPSEALALALAALMHERLSSIASAAAALGSEPAAGLFFEFA